MALLFGNYSREEKTLRLDQVLPESDKNRPGFFQLQEIQTGSRGDHGLGWACACDAPTGWKAREM